MTHDPEHISVPWLERKVMDALDSTEALSGDFYRVSIELPSGKILSCHVAKLALKISNGEKP